MPIIDESIVREQFAMLDPETAAALAEAVSGDFGQWGDRLVAAAAARDAAAQQRARHALKGLCGAFGAVDLQNSAEMALDDAPSRQAFLACRDATVAAILTVAHEAGRGGPDLPGQ